MSTLNVKIHPVVLLNIVDSYERRSRDQKRVIGTLLGNVDKSGTIEVSNSFVVQHREADGEVAFDIEVAKDLYELHRKVNPNESIVGWFATGGGEVNEYSVLIHEFYTRETSNPVHITVDPTSAGISVKGYTLTPFGVPGKSTGTMFSHIKSVDITGGYEAEMIGLKACMAASGIGESKAVTYDSEIDMILAASKKCSDIITSIVKYIDENIITPGKPLPSNSNDIGRELMSMVESIGPLCKDEETINKNLNDLLMVIYLSNLCKTQLMLNEKLTLV
ncbi:eukaryotic translation initiation factor 3 subunit F-1-like [Panonychus citri]|uniref:eukaryotic translation initiation factor 3 subunit F-1-like n=1 Tax=Panonychus citri TaxID=50023 RepID=UPI0023073416|nr:eukaryotic translation initiation factor 3 subunit F-1-like [Panonychus citri]